jgi:outer membrane protein OmpA-like peptidoglycan-associated protein
MEHKSYIIKLVVSLCILAFCSFTPVKKYIKQAEKELENGHINECKDNYKKALEIEPENYSANLGIGLVLCELQDNFKEALPYLEKACKNSVKDTLTDLKYALAKCYQVNEMFDKALYYLKRLNGLVDYDNEIDFAVEIQKRILDCHYSIAHQNEKISENIYVVNAGKRINTEMPEYVPIIAAQNGLIFTSKRKDDKKEEINYLDGKYFESIYLSVVDSNKRRAPTRFAGLDKALKSKFGRKHESLVSLSSNGNKWFVFADNLIYEIEMNGTKVVKIKKLGASINFNAYQNHAFLSQDSKTIFFTSDAEGGKGGNDIYFSKQNSLGEWEQPVSIGDSINTLFDEEAPFLSVDEKTLYFSSKGHPGYGNFDMYKSELRNGKWSAPINLGKPYNSSANDLFFVIDSAQTCSFFSSARLGGFGDMDIYKIIYVDKIDKSCADSNSYPIQLAIVDENRKDYANAIKTFIPPEYKVINYEWTLDNAPVSSPINIFEKDYLKDGIYNIGFKVVALCDTCIIPVVSCSVFKNKIEKEIEIVKPIEVVSNQTTTNAPITSTNTSYAAQNTDKIKEEEKANTTGNNETLANNIKASQNSNNTSINKGATEKEALQTLNNSKGIRENLSNLKSRAVNSSEEMASLGFVNENVLFKKNSSKISSKPNEALIKNAQILKNNSNLQVEILGYADTSGTVAYNNALSQDRANHVWYYLVKHGVKKSQIRLIKGLGPIKPDGSCGNDKACIEKQNEDFRKVVLNLYIKS